jgi:arachidonate 15-lipoxygenase
MSALIFSVWNFVEGLLRRLLGLDLEPRPALPRNDPEPARRAERLALRRQQYVYNHRYVAPLALADQVPFAERPGLAWLVLVGRTMLRIFENTVAAGLDEASSGPDSPRVLRQGLRRLRGRSGRCRDHAENVAAIEPYLASVLRPAPADSGGARSLPEYRAQFRTMPVPAGADLLHDDLSFARLRLSGPNPLLLRRALGVRRGARVSPAQFRALPAFANDSLAAAKRDGRLFELDYSIMRGMQAGNRPRGRKYLYAPWALFAVSPADRNLHPVAIQCAPGGPTFRPDGSWQWQMAKTTVQVADGNYHETILHLGRTHLVIEAFVLATRRQLDDRHPVSLLLRPHFEGTLYINDLAQSVLIAPGGGVEQLLAGTLKASRDLTGRDLLQHYRFNDEFLPRNLARRGVADPATLPDYPYRDDAQPIWDAIREWVADYLALYYCDDADVGQDRELAAWAAELVSPKGGVLQGFGEGARGTRRGSPKAPLIATRDYLSEALTMVIFTASAQHAVVNFPQNTVMSYTPAVPLAAYAPAPGEGGGGRKGAQPGNRSKRAAARAHDENDWLAMLPPLDLAREQLELTAALGSVFYTRLGRYPGAHFRDTRVAAPLSRFRRRLGRIESKIAARNRTRPEPYPYLLPSKIPQSINI